MKTKNLLTLCVAVTMIFTACKKPGNPSTTDKHLTKSSRYDENKNLKHVPQKMYNLDPAVATQLVKKFKHLDTQNQARLIEDDYVALDSAVWVLEAALNWDYDYQNAYEENYHNFRVTYDCTIPMDNEEDQNVSSDDLEDRYEVFKGQIDALTDNDTTKIKIIDVEGFTYDPGTSSAKLTVNIHYFSVNIATGCFFIYPAYPVDAVYYPWGGGWITPCLTPPLQLRAAAYFEDVMNCGEPIIPCVGEGIRGFWTTVITQNYSAADWGSGNPYPTALYSCAYTDESLVCNIPVLTTTDLGAFKSNAIPLAQSNCPSYLVISVIDIDSKYDYYYDNFASIGYFDFYWDMNPTLGKWNCKPIYE